MEFLLNFLDYIKINIEFNFFYTFVFFFIFLLAYNSFSMPGGIIFMAATGYFFGTFIGYFLSIITLVLGSLIFFSFSHFFIQKFSPKFIKKYISIFQKYISKSSFEYLIIFRMIPGPPLFVQNIILSFLKITKTNFILSTFIGFSPIVFMAVFLGNQLNDISYLKDLSFKDMFTFKFLIFIFMLISFLLIRVFYKK